MKTNNFIEKNVIGFAEKIVIEYANASGRADYRPFVREACYKILPELLLFQLKEVERVVDSLKKDESKDTHENNLPPLDLVRMYNQALSDIKEGLRV